MEANQQDSASVCNENSTPTEKVDESDIGSVTSDARKLGENIETESVVTGESDMVTLNEIVEADDYLQRQAKAVLGSADSKVCSYPEGYIPRQPLYACLTCVKDQESAAICFGCSLHCHEGHKLIELFTKRKIRCDCGNSKFPSKCLLYEEKDSLNTENTYNHNYQGLYCTCNRPYPDEGFNGDMFQCTMCEDWYHGEHLNLKNSENSEVNFDFNDLICKTCLEKFPFLSVFENSTETVCLKDRVFEGTITNDIALTEQWRSHLCSCSFCEGFYDKNNISFLLDSSDDVAQYEKECIEKTKNEEQDEDQIVDELVRNAGRETAIQVIRGFHDLKSNLANFLGEITESGVKVVTTDHINSFFQTMKRRRLDDDEQK